MRAILLHSIEKIRLFWRSHRRFCTLATTFFSIAFLITLGFLLPAHAADTQSGTQISSFGQAALDEVAGFFAQILLWLARLFQRLTLFEVEFLQVVASYNGYLGSTAVNVGWVVVRDVSNMAFVIILLVIAFATILGSEAYEWKKLLPKMIMAAVLINFSRTICGVLIDASQVVIITFLNAISATIGGSVIQSFYFTSFEKFHASAAGAGLTSNTLANFAVPGVFSAAVVAVVFSAIVCIIMGFYVAILLARVIRLWVLIVLSPLAFIFSILPATQGYAKQWWDELMDDLVTGPVILFFVWLAFVIVGSGQVNQELINGSQSSQKNALGAEFQSQTAGVSDVLGWNNLANLIIGIGILLVGVRVSGQIGGTSGSILSSALTFGKRVATIASGYAAGRWLYEKGASAVKAIPGAVFDATVAKPIGRIGSVIKSRARTLYNTVPVVGGLARDLTAKDLYANGAYKGFGGKTVGTVAAWFLETGARKDKRVADYEATADLTDEIRERSFGTSKEGAGPKKQRYGEINRALEELDAAKKVEKTSDEREKQEKVARDIEKELLPFEEALTVAKKLPKGPGRDRAIRNAEKNLAAKKDQFGLEEQVYYGALKETAVSRAKGEISSHVLHNQEREADIRAKADLLAKDHDIHAKEQEGFRAAAAADILEGELHAKEKLGEVTALEKAKRGPLAAAENSRIEHEEDAALIEERLRSSEEEARAKATETAFNKLTKETKDATAAQKAQVEIIRNSIQAEKDRIEALKRQEAFDVMKTDPENQRRLRDTVALTAEINGLNENIKAGQDKLQSQADLFYGVAIPGQVGSGKGAATKAETLSIRAAGEVAQQQLAAEESLREVEAELQALQTYKTEWERVHRAQMESQIRETDLDSRRDEIKAEQAHQLQIDPGILSRLEDETRKRRARIDQLKESISTKQNLEQIKQNHWLASDEQGKELADLINKDKAAAEELQVELGRTKEIKLAEERDKNRLQKGQTSVHVKAVRTKHFLEDQKLYQNISYDQMMINEDDLNKRTEAIREIIRNKVASGQSVTEEQGLLKNLKDQRAEILAFVTSQGGEYARYGTERLLGELKNIAKSVKINDGENFADEESIKSIENLQAQVISAALHRTVEATQKGVEDGLNELKKEWGDDFTARLGILVKNLDDTAGDGSRNLGGLFRVHADEGVEDYRAVNLRDKEKRAGDLAHLKNKRNEALARHSPAKLVTIGNSVSRGEIGVKGEADHKEDGLLFETSEDRKVLEKTFSRLNYNALGTVNIKLINDLNEGFANTMKKYGEKSEQVLGAINAIIGRSTQPDAVFALLDSTDALKGKLELVKNTEGTGKNPKIARFK